MALSISALDLVPLGHGGTSVAALRAAAELARAVDRLGYTRLWYAEHHNMPGIATTPEILIAYVGSMTAANSWGRAFVSSNIRNHLRHS